MGPTETETKPTVARVTVNLPWKVWEAVQAMAAEGHTTKTEVLRQAIATEAWRRRVLENEEAEIVVRKRKPDGSYEHERVEWV